MLAEEDGISSSKRLLMMYVYMYMYTGPMTLGTLGVQATGYRLQADMHANCYLLQKYL